MMAIFALQMLERTPHLKRNFGMSLRDYRHLFFCFSALLILQPFKGISQNKADTLQPFPIERQVQVDFLSHYYEQDGNHSAVTGGLGTEELTDVGGIISVTIPLDSVARLELASSLNHYTSASTDNIDSYVSSASRKDSRAYVHVGYGKDKKESGWSVGAGGSFESDYLSTSLTGIWFQTYQDGLNQLSVSWSLFLDTWLVIFPEELRAPGLVSVPTNKRRSFQTAVTWSQPINPRLRVSVTFEPVLQQGLLSTPFHRVYYVNELLPGIEQLPGWRLKLPVGLRANYYLSDWLISRFFYRFYWDSFGILGHTASLELPIKPGPFIAFYPFYRFHWQQAATWFREYSLHERTAPFATSDFDLSGFTSQKVGGGISLYPLYGLMRWKMSPIRVGMWEQVDFRYARFIRSDGLNANSFSLGIRMRF